MPVELDEIVRPPRTAAPGESRLVAGRIVSINPLGRAFVDFPGNPGGPIAAQSALTSREAGGGATPGAPVLLLFGAQETLRPIIVGLIRDQLVDPSGPAQVELTAPFGESRISLDGRRLVLEAKDEIVLRCGEGSITLKADGTVVVRGKRLLSRSAGTNVIRGASVKIN